MDVPPATGASQKPIDTKKSQRSKLTCPECSRRKIKCDKESPCDRCLARGVPHLCRPYGSLPEGNAPAELTSHQSGPANWEGKVATGTTLTDSDTFRTNVYAELDVLRRRIFALEDMHSRITRLEDAQNRRTAPPPPLSHQNNVTAETQVDAGGNNDLEGDAAVTLEFFALGTDRRDPNATADDGDAASGRAPSPTYNMLDNPSPKVLPECVLSVLLTRIKVEHIMDIAEKHCLWQHACVDALAFDREVRAFYDLLDMPAYGSQRFQYVSPSWLALYLAVQALAVYQMTSEEGQLSGLNAQQLEELPNALLQGSLACMEAAKYLEKPTLPVLQAIAILVSCARDFMDPGLAQSLLAIGIKSAQTLNLHKSSSYQSTEHVEAKPNNWSNSNIGKNVWWTLVVQDWYQYTYKGCCLVHPGQFDTPIPEDLCEDTTSGPSIVFKLSFSAALASIVRSYFAKLEGALTASCHEALLQADRNIRDLSANLPEILGSSRKGQGQPSYIPDLRLYLHITSQHKLIVIHRAFISSGSANPEQKQRSHQASIKAARSLLSHLSDAKALQRAAVWQIPYHTVSAATLLVLSCFKEEVGERALARSEAQSALSTLREVAQHSSVARRGAHVLESLLAEEAKWEDANYRQKRKADGGIEGVVKRIKLPVVQVSVSTSPPDPGLAPVQSSQTALPQPSHPVTYQLPPEASSNAPPRTLADALDDDWRVIESLFSAYPEFMGGGTNSHL